MGPVLVGALAEDAGRQQVPPDRRCMANGTQTCSQLSIMVPKRFGLATDFLVYLYLGLKAYTIYLCRCMP